LTLKEKEGNTAEKETTIDLKPLSLKKEKIPQNKPIIIPLPAKPVIALPKSKKPPTVDDSTQTTISAHDFMQGMVS